MIESQQQAFASPELHWLNNGPGPFYAVRRATQMQNLLSMPANQDKGNPAPIAHEKSSKSSPHTENSNVRPPKGEGKGKPNELRTCILATTLGFANVTALAPIERVSILIQCQSEMMKTGRLSTPYKGMKDCLLRTIKHDGFLSLWRGNSVSLIRVCATQTLLFPFKDDIQKKIEESRLWLLPLSVMPGFLLFYPLDYARIRLACDVKTPGKLKLSLYSSAKSLRNDVGITRQFSGLFDVFNKTLRLDGIRGLYRGCTVSCIGYAAYHIASNDLISNFSKEQGNQKKPTWPGLAKMFFSGV